MTATKIEIDPNEVYESIRTRVIGLGLDDYYKLLQDYNIEHLSAELEPCIMESKGNRFIICRAPYSNSGSIKIPEQIAISLSGDPYFDNKPTEEDFTEISNMLDHLSEEDKKIVEKAKELGDGSGNRNMEVAVTVKINCDWNGDPWSPEVSVGDIDLDYRDVREQLVEVQYEAKQKVLKNVSEYKNIVQRIAIDLKISSEDTHRYIMGWL